MFRIAVTGNIGTGKTTVCKVFESLGIHVYYADMEAKKFYRQESVIQAVKKLFGDDVFTAEGNLDAENLASIVFGDEQKIKQLNAIIHPLVLEDYLQWAKAHKNEAYTIYESALLFESGFIKHFHSSILVTAPPDLARHRVFSRSGVSKADFDRRLAMQMPQDQKSELASYIIVNDESSPLIPRIMEIHKLLIV